MNPEEIKQLRNSLGLSQQSFAEKLGVSIRSVSRWEAGKAKPTRMAIKVIGMVFGKQGG